ncbi:MAG TPA: hypothetical protein VIK95_11445 [Egibacteraceae bacterium]
MAKTKAKAKQATRRPSPPPARAEDSGRRALWIVVSVVVLVVAVYGVRAYVNDPERRIAQRTAELTAEETERDRQQIQELTEQARTLVEDLSPMLDEMAAALPSEEEPAQPVDRQTVEGWRTTTAEAAAVFENPPSGATGTNVARQSFAVGVDTLAAAVETYALALDAQGEQQTALLRQASTQRDLAVRSWGIGATQLDQINVDAGFGHQHVYLDSSGTEGAMTADEAEEGSGAVEDAGAQDDAGAQED